MPAWTEHVIWWHVYPLGFTGADTTGTDRTGISLGTLARGNYLVLFTDGPQQISAKVVKQ